MLVISSLLNAVYYFRIIEQMFVQREASLVEIHHPDSKFGLPMNMVLPIGITGLGILFLGIYSSDLVTRVIQLGLPEVFLR